MTDESDSSLVDLTGRQPSWPVQVSRLWLDCTQVALEDATHVTTPPRTGVEDFRRALASRLETTADRIMITCGVRAMATLIAKPGNEVVLEKPGFRGVLDALESAGSNVELSRWEDFASLALRRPQRLFWVTPVGRNPDGAELNSDLIDVLKEIRVRGGKVVANETYRWYGNSRNRVEADLYVGSLSKLAGGGCRLGWLEADPEVLSAIALRSNAWPATLTQITWAKFLERGGFDLLRSEFVDKTVAARQAFVAIALNALNACAKSASGPSIMLRATEGRGREARHSLLAAGVLVGPGTDFLADERDLRLCFSSVSIEEASRAAEIVVDMNRRGYFDISD